jgi:hypothetical protein
MTPRAPPSANVATWLSLRFERGTRYYQLHLERNIWGGWILTRVSGRRNTRLSRALLTSARFLVPHVRSSAERNTSG